MHRRIALSVAFAALACSATPPAPRSPLCDAAATPVGEVQGRRGKSPLVGREATVLGTVVADFQAPDELGGLFLQGEKDRTETTSDGLFVAVGEPDFAAGDVVAVRGKVAEVDGTTSLVEVEEVARCGLGTVGPTFVELPTGGLERLEGMLVTFPQTLTVNDVRALGSEGRVGLVWGGRPFAPKTGLAPAGAPDPADLRQRLIVDDGRRLAHPPLRLEGPRVPRVGDTVTGVTGVLRQGPDGWALETLAPPTVAPRNPRPAAPPAVGGRFGVASFNVLNYFTTLGARGAETAEELALQRGKIATAIAALGADVVAVLELENGPGVDADLVAALDAKSGGPAWASVAPPPGGAGDDEIRVGLLYRRDRVQPVGAALAEVGDVHPRPPLAQTFRVGEERLSVVVVHFKSKRCDGAQGDEADRRDGGGCWNGTRSREARSVAAFVARVAKTSGDPDVLVVGDLNAHAAEEPVAVLLESGLVDLAAAHVEPASRYSYVYQGLSGQLDYAFATPSLAVQTTGAGFWHVNADEAPFLAYDRGGRPEAPVALDPYRSSDHDPLLVGLDLGRP